MIGRYWRSFGAVPGVNPGTEAQATGTATKDAGRGK